jgi:amidase
VADILEITLAEQGVMVAVPGVGALGAQIVDPQTKIVPLQGRLAVFSEEVQVPIRPMVGTIGTAPKQGAILNGTPGPHGGNMDCTTVGEGCKVYLPVEVPGALFGLGDLHAVQGDGETGGSGVEIAGQVRLRLGLLKQARLPLPLIETPEVVATICSDEDLDVAAQGAIDNMLRLLTEQVGMPLNEADMLMSILGWIRICQVMNPRKTCRMEMPKWVLERYGFAMAPPE